MNLIKSTENAGSPPKALLDAIAKFGQEAIGTRLDCLGWWSVSERDGRSSSSSTEKLTISDGPFTESKKLIAVYAI